MIFLNRPLVGKCLEPETSTLKWLFQLDDSKSLHEKWLFHQTSIKKWLFGVPGELMFGGPVKTMLHKKGNKPISIGMT